MVSKPKTRKGSLVLLEIELIIILAIVILLGIFFGYSLAQEDTNFMYGESRTQSVGLGDRDNLKT